MRLPPGLLVLFVGSAAVVPSLAEEVSFKRDLIPLFKTRCVACHLTGEEAVKLPLHPSAAYRSLVNVPSQESSLLRVKPGAPAQSYLMHKLEGTHLEVGGSGLRMPMDGQLDAAQIEMVRAWIKAGAPDN